MITYKRIILIFVLLSGYAFSCSCRFVTTLDSYESYKEIKSAFVCKILTREIVNNSEYFTAEIIRSFKGKHEKIIKIRNGAFVNPSVGCEVRIKSGQVLLMLLDKFTGVYYIDGCSFYESSNYFDFHLDTLFFNQFGKPDGLMDLPFAKGQLKNGKQEGLWEIKTKTLLRTFTSEVGYYKNGKREGSWISYFHNDYTTFKKDSLNYASDKKNIVNELLMPNGNLYYKLSFKSDFSNYHLGKLTGTSYVYYPNGKLYGTSNYKNGKEHGISICYSETGRVIWKSILINGKQSRYFEYTDSCIFEKKIINNVTRKIIYSTDTIPQKEITVKNNKGIYFEYYNNGVVKTKVAFNKKGSFVGSFDTFNVSGKIVSKRQLTEDTRLIGDEVWYHFSYYDQ